MTEHDPNSILTGIQDPDDASKPLTRARAVEILTEKLTQVKDFVVEGHQHWTDNQDIAHIVAGLAVLHDHTHYLTSALLTLAQHDATEDAIEEQIVAVTVPDTIPAEWLA